MSRARVQGEIHRKQLSDLLYQGRSPKVEGRQFPLEPKRKVWSYCHVLCEMQGWAAKLPGAASLHATSQAATVTGTVLERSLAGAGILTPQACSTRFYNFKESGYWNMNGVVWLLGRKQQENESYELSFFINMELFLEPAFIPLPGKADRNEFTSDYSL